MPLAVRRLRRVDRPVAFHVARAVQAERQDLPVLLEGEKHAPGSGLDAEDLVEARERGGLHPRGDGKRIECLRQRVRRHLRTAVFRVKRPAYGRRQPPQRIRFPVPFRCHTGHEQDYHKGNTADCSHVLLDLLVQFEIYNPKRRRNGTIASKYPSASTIGARCPS